MKLGEVMDILDRAGYAYVLLNRDVLGDYYRKHGFTKAQNDAPAQIIRIVNPKHNRNIDFIFEEGIDESDLDDVAFGGFFHEFGSFTDEYQREEIPKLIQMIMDGRVHIIIARDGKSGQWLYSGRFDDDEDETMNNMDEFKRNMNGIRKRKGVWAKLTRQRRIYEVFDWHNAEIIEK